MAGTEPVQRDLYSAFLGLCVDPETQTVNRSQAEALWPSTRRVLEKAMLSVIETASCRPLPASLGAREWVLRSELFAFESGEQVREAAVA